MTRAYRDAGMIKQRLSMRYVVSILAICAGACVMLTGLPGCDDVFCGRNSRAVKGAEALDKRYLTQLHDFVASDRCGHRCSPDILRPLESFASREPVLKVRPDGDASITLSYCFDRGVELIFKDTKTPDATISVAWGSIEWEYIELWSKRQQEDAK